ncbi:hypothetical protein B0T24DRAFT_170765 [Lasiosphaeria ovina]|uniref:Uncharacterized protein n=1 Tax=Lasiosphaeria ovina TaxID=92902 RepID=A0AAE0NE49_9PEZI|nr:hypothetical protein B0T24DRAFT_170765 [Lasiosphaeria ovina]
MTSMARSGRETGSSLLPVQYSSCRSSLSTSIVPPPTLPDSGIHIAPTLPIHHIQTTALRRNLVAVAFRCSPALAFWWQSGRSWVDTLQTSRAIYFHDNCSVWIGRLQEETKQSGAEMAFTPLPHLFSPQSSPTTVCTGELKSDGSNDMELSARPAPGLGPGYWAPARREEETMNRQISVSPSCSAYLPPSLVNNLERHVEKSIRKPG